MTPDAWTTFWSVLIIVAIGGFLVLAVVVAIGGYRDVKSMFSQIDRSHREKEHRSGD